MPYFVVTSSHRAEDCGVAMRESPDPSDVAHVKAVAGLTYCTCPYGAHGSVTVVEANERADAERLTRHSKVERFVVAQAEAMPLAAGGAHAHH